MALTILRAENFLTFCSHPSGPSSNDRSSAILLQYRPPRDRSNLSHSETAKSQESLRSQYVTIIIPTYKRPVLLRRALSSALNQTYPHLQVCVYDNASGDETAEVVSEFMRKDARVKYHSHSQNIGMINNYAYALSQVDTPYFSLLSDDDVLFPWFLEEAFKGFEQFPDIGFSAASTMIMSEKGDVVSVPLDLWQEEGYFPSPLGMTEMIPKYPVPTCILFRKEVIEENPIDKDNELTWDCDFLLQIAARRAFFISKRPCGIFLHHETSFSNVQQFEKWQVALGRVEQRLLELPHFSEAFKQLMSSRIAHHLMLCGRGCIFHFIFKKNFKEARTCAAAFRKWCGWNFSSLLFSAASEACYFFPPAFFFFQYLQKARKRRKLRSSRYQQYTSYLNLSH